MNENNEDILIEVKNPKTGSSGKVSLQDLDKVLKMGGQINKDYRIRNPKTGSSGIVDPQNIPKLLSLGGVFDEPTWGERGNMLVGSFIKGAGQGISNIGDLYAAGPKAVGRGVTMLGKTLGSETLTSIGRGIRDNARDLETVAALPKEYVTDPLRDYIFSQNASPEDDKYYSNTIAEGLGSTAVSIGPVSKIGQGMIYGASKIPKSVGLGWARNSLNGIGKAIAWTPKTVGEGAGLAAAVAGGTVGTELSREALPLEKRDNLVTATAGALLDFTAGMVGGGISLKTGELSLGALSSLNKGRKAALNNVSKEVSKPEVFFKNVNKDFKDTLTSLNSFVISPTKPKLNREALKSFEAGTEPVNLPDILGNGVYIKTLQSLVGKKAVSEVAYEAVLKATPPEQIKAFLDKTLKKRIDGTDAPQVISSEYSKALTERTEEVKQVGGILYSYMRESAKGGVTDVTPIIRRLETILNEDLKGFEAPNAEFTAARTYFQSQLEKYTNYVKKNAEVIYNEEQTKKLTPHELLKQAIRDGSFDPAGKKLAISEKQFAKMEAAANPAPKEKTILKAFMPTDQFVIDWENYANGAWNKELGRYNRLSIDLKKVYDLSAQTSKGVDPKFYKQALQAKSFYEKQVIPLIKDELAVSLAKGETPTLAYEQTASLKGLDILDNLLKNEKGKFSKKTEEIIKELKLTRIKDMSYQAFDENDMFDPKAFKKIFFREKSYENINYMQRLFGDKKKYDKFKKIFTPIVEAEEKAAASAKIKPQPKPQEKDSILETGPILTAVVADLLVGTRTVLPIMLTKHILLKKLESIYFDKKVINKVIERGKVSKEKTNRRKNLIRGNAFRLLKSGGNDQE